MTQLDTVKRHDGNTKDRRARCWFLTINNYSKEDIENLKGFDKYVFQEEKGTKGTVHIQGMIYNKNPIKFSTMKNRFPKAHIEVTRSLKHAIQYCSKVESRNGKTWVKGFKVKRKVYDLIDDKGPLVWQNELIDIVKEDCKKDCRKIHWIWSKKGCKGKTILAKHLVLKYGAIVVGGRIQDACYCIQKKIENGEEIKIVIFDVARSGKLPCFESVEKIKNGLVFSSKYESGMLVFDVPHVIIFANIEPDTLKLSDDRWVIKCVD